MDATKVVLEKSWNPTSVLPEKHWDLTKLNKGLRDPASKRRKFHRKIIS
jgi:hypothetical protein